MDKQSAIDTAVTILQSNFPELTAERLSSLLEPPQERISLAEAGKLLGISYHGAHALIKRQKIPGFNGGAGWRVNKADVIRYRDGDLTCSSSV